MGIPRIRIINPNSTEAVTAGIAAAVAPFANGVELICETLADAPPAIESRAHIDAVVPMLVDRVSTGDADAYVIACYSDPGIDACRQETRTPVFGISESAMAVALTRGERFGVVSILQPSVERHIAYVEELGLSERMAGDRAVGLGVLELEAADDALDRMIETGQRLRDDDGADVLILGCAGMAAQRTAMETALGIPVIEPCQAAALMAAGAVLNLPA